MTSRSLADQLLEATKEIASANSAKQKIRSEQKDHFAALLAEAEEFVTTADRRAANEVFALKTALKSAMSLNNQF